MSAPTIVYLHGFRSSPASVKARLLGRAIDALPPERRPRYHVPALSHEPATAFTMVADWIEREAGPDAAALTLVGSSLGGYYATALAERYGTRAVLVNPAIRPYEDLAPYAGTHTNLYTGDAFEVIEEHFAELRALAVERVTRPERYFLLVRTGDEVLDWREAVAFYAGAGQYVAGGGDHSWADFTPEIPAVLRFAGVAA